MFVEFFFALIVFANSCYRQGPIERHGRGAQRRRSLSLSLSFVVVSFVDRSLQVLWGTAKPTDFPTIAIALPRPRTEHDYD